MKAKPSGRGGAMLCMGADPDIWRADGMSMEGKCLKCGGSSRLSATCHPYMENDLLILAFTGQLPAVLFHDLSGDGKTKPRPTGS